MRRLVAVLLAGILAACGGDTAVRSDAELSAREIEEAEVATQEELPGPPPVVVRGGGLELALEPYTFCYGNGCADGIPPEDPPSIGSPAEVEVEFPLEGWEFDAMFQAAGEECARTQTVAVERTGPTTLRLTPAGRAGTYDVDLFGRGGGDLFARFRWTTPVDGPPPVPEARLALLADHDGEVDSYGIALMIENLAASPATATATVTVTAANGRSLTFEAERSAPLWGCGDPEGTLYWDGPDDEGAAAAGLGPRPFAYEVVVTLDGTRHVAEATWPDDEIAGNEPSVALAFDPPLPALAG